MELRQLNHFLAIAEAGGFARAAQLLGLTQQALSLSIAKLEGELGVQLFERTGSGTTLTLFGETFRHHAQLAITETGRAAEAVRLLRDAAAGELRVGFGETMLGRIAPDSLLQMRRKFPGIRLHIEEGYTELLMPRLLAGQLDVLAGSPSVTWHADPAIEQEFLFEVEDIVTARADHPLARKRDVSLADMQAYPWLVGVRPGEYEVLCEAYQNAGLRPPADIVWSSTLATGLALLLRDDFLALAGPDIFATLMQAGLMRRVRASGLQRSRRALVCRRAGAASPAALAMIEEIRIAAQRYDEEQHQKVIVPRLQQRRTQRTTR